MATHDPDTGAPDRTATDQRYAALEVANDAVVIYDERNHRSWVQSDEAVALEDVA